MKEEPEETKAFVMVQLLIERSRRVFQYPPKVIDLSNYITLKRGLKCL
jgi:hypothetical protein